MSQSFGGIENQGERLVWTALEWQRDGTFIHLTVDPRDRRIELRLDTHGLERPQPPPGRWVGALALLFLVAGITLGIWQRSIMLGGTTLTLVFGVWIGIDARRHSQAQRRRTIDAAWWDAHVEACLRQASSSSDP
jgi:hypothetical protein